MNLSKYFFGWCLGFGILFLNLNAEGYYVVDLGVSVSFENFEKRFEKGLRSKFEKDPKFLLSDDGVNLSGVDRAINVDVRYPVRAFPGEAGVYVKIYGEKIGTRYMYYSHLTERDGDLSIQQSDVLIDKVADDLIFSIKGHLNGRRPLKIGYYENRQLIKLEKSLDVELIGRKVTPWKDLISPPASSKVSLLEEEMTNLPSLDQPLPSSRQDMVRREKHLKVLSQSWKPEERAESYRELSRLYAKEGLDDDALQLAEKALEEDKSVESRKLAGEIRGKEWDPMSRFRLKNEHRGMSIDFKNALEYDTNIVQEEVDNLTSTDTKDWGIMTSLDFDWNWRKRDAGWGQMTSFDLSNETYTKHKELDLVGLDLSHELSYGGGKNNPWLWTLEMGYRTYFRRGTSLMDGLHLGTGALYLLNPRSTIGFALNTWEMNYSHHFYNQDERSGDRLQWDIYASHALKTGQTFYLRTGFAQIDVGDASLSYGAWNVRGEASTTSNLPWVDRAFAKLGYERRSYDVAENAFRMEREDAKFEYGLGFRVAPFEKHVLEMEFMHTDAQSTRRVSYYRREQFRLSYLVRF